MYSDIKFREDLVRSSDDNIALLFTESIADHVHSLHDGNIEIESWVGKSAELSKSGDNSSLHRGDEPKHMQ